MGVEDNVSGSGERWGGTRRLGLGFYAGFDRDIGVGLSSVAAWRSLWCLEYGFRG